MSHLHRQICRTKDITDLDMNHETVFELFTKAVSEVGELAEALCVEELSFGSCHRKIDESSAIEAIDLAICALAIFFARGGKVDEIATIMEQKLDKWERNQKSTIESEDLDEMQRELQNNQLVVQKLYSEIEKTTQQARSLQTRILRKLWAQKDEQPTTRT